MALVLEQRHHPVAGDDRQSERRGLERSERPQPPVTQDTAPRAVVAESPAGTGREHGEDAGTGERETGPVGGAPAEGRFELWDDHQRKPAARHRGAAVGALPERPATAAANEVEAGDEACARSKPHQRPSGEADRETCCSESDPVSGGDDGERGEPDALRADPVDQAPAGDLRRQMCHEQRCRQEPDRRE